MSMEDNILCARLYSKGDLRVETTAVPIPGPNEVQVRMAFVGLCASDVHFYDDGAIDHYIVKQPLILGHEMSGVISQLGSDVTEVKVGDRVAIDPNRPCMKCRYCKKNRYNICETNVVAGIPPTDGGFSRYMVTPSSTCHKLPDHVALQAGACMEPLSIGVHGLHRGQLAKGDVVVVSGAGPIGLLAMQAAKALGASKVMIVDVNPKRLELASKLGVDLVHQTKGMGDPKEAANAIKEALGEEADVVLECSGGKGTVDTAIHMCRPGGRVVMLGFGEMAMNVHIGMAAVREIDIIGSVCNSRNFPECVDLVATGKVNFTPVISHFLPLAQAKDAIDLVREGGKSVKVMIDCQK